MAGGIYGGAAAGLESGFNMAMRLDQAQQDRQLREQQLAMQQRAADRADAMTAFTTARQLRDDLAKEGSGLATQYGANVPPELATDYEGRVKAAHDAYTAAANKLVPHVQAEKQAGQNLFSDLQAGNVKLQDVPPGQFVQALTATTGRPVSDFVPGPNGEPSPVEQGLTKLKTGLQTGNEQYVLDGANAMLAPELQKGVGQPSPHGGTIVGKKIVKFLPMPPSDPNNPNDPNDPNKGKVVPVLRVFVSNQDPQAGVGEKRAQMEREAQQYGAPAGATGHYDAPLTQYRSTDPNDPIAHLDINEAMDRAMRLGSIASMMRNPQFASYVDQGVKQVGSAPDDFLKALYSTGGTMPTKPQVTYENVPAGGVTYRIGKDTTGKEISRETLQHEAAPINPNAAPPTRHVNANGDTVDQEWDAKTQTWKEVGRGPKFKQGVGGSLGIGAAGLTDEENAALFGPHGAVTEGRLDPNRINSRTARLLADAELTNPGTDFAGMSGDIQLGRNQTFRTRAMVAETLPTIMQNMVNAGKKVDFSNYQPVARMQAWVKGQTNDPDLTEYMVQRNDALMSIAGVMRGVGMTDQAHRAETEVAAPTMSPQALDAWMRGQMHALQPRLEQYRGITAPRGRRAGGVSASLGGAPAPSPATSGAPAPGTVMQGYRFKGGDPAQQANWERVQ